jgi:hypothetical protein
MVVPLLPFDAGSCTASEVAAPAVAVRADPAPNSITVTTAIDTTSSCFVRDLPGGTDRMGGSVGCLNM